MGLFKKFKEALPTIGAAAGFALTGGNPALGAAIGGGLGSLAAGKSVEDSLKNAALAGAVGYGATEMGFGKGTGMQRFSRGPVAGSIPSGYVGPGGTPQVAQVAKQAAGNEGILSIFDDMTFGQKAALGVGAATLLGSMEEAEQPKTFSRYDDSYEGEAFGEVVGPLTGNVYSMADESDRKEYNKELQRYQKPGFNYAHGGDVNLGIQVVGGSSGDHTGGGEVDGPGTGTSDSVPARLSDGEFVLTAKAVRGAGGGDRDIGAARLYDMMSELEARG